MVVISPHLAVPHLAHLDQPDVLKQFGQKPGAEDGAMPVGMVDLAFPVSVGIDSPGSPQAGILFRVEPEPAILFQVIIPFFYIELIIVGIIFV